MKPVCLDSSAWIEITHNGPNARTFLKAADDITLVIVSTITIYEVWKYAITHADENRAQHLIDLFRQAIVIPPDTEIAVAAANISKHHKLPLADSLIYATTRIHKATLWTQDDDFEGLANVKYLPKTKKS